MGATPKQYGFLFSAWLVVKSGSFASEGDWGGGWVVDRGWGRGWQGKSKRRTRAKYSISPYVVRREYPIPGVSTPLFLGIHVKEKSCSLGPGPPCEYWRHYVRKRERFQFKRKKESKKKDETPIHRFNPQAPFPFPSHLPVGTFSLFAIK